jgi:2',3'-cyclic-nucleotide 2'-phosphodiesterase (5'-nucleotidase family)
MRRTVSAVLLAIILACIAATSCRGMTAPQGQVPTGAPAEITALHINDTHAHLEDVASRATLVKKVRDKVGTDRALMFDSGDVFMGTPYFNLTKGKTDLEFMNTLGYDAMTLAAYWSTRVQVFRLSSQR